MGIDSTLQLMTREGGKSLVCSTSFSLFIYKYYTVLLEENGCLNPLLYQYQS